MIERNFDISFIANLALREKQIQQNYRPIIAVHKWFARRPGTLFRGLLLSEFSNKTLKETFYQPNHFPGLWVADPFMGGGTPLLEANRTGCNVIGFDINPMSYWIVKQEIEHLDLSTYMNIAYSLRKELENEIGHLYRTRCTTCGNEDAHVKYFLWVKVIQCFKCNENIDLFPGYLLSANSRHPKNVVLCHNCGQLTETSDINNPGVCSNCLVNLSINGPAKKNRCVCPKCGSINTFPNKTISPPNHRLFAIEYHCPSCKNTHAGRFFKTPDYNDLDKIDESKEKLERVDIKYVPDDQIPSGDETNRLHKWGYMYYREMFNVRQLLGLELSAKIIARTPNERIRNALATNLSDLLRYQNMLCRYDAIALKSLDIFSIHGFPVGLIQCESNILGIRDPDKKTCIGSGGWLNIIDKFVKAKSYCDNPYEVRYHGNKKEIIPIRGEWIGDHLNGKHKNESRIVDIQCRDAATVSLPPMYLDAVFTDPPYYGNVQYAELMDFCYVWLRRLIKNKTEMFNSKSTRNSQELTVNIDMGRGLEHFTEGISSVFQRMAKSLKQGSPLVFTYHHNDIKSYYPIAVAILDAGLICSASFPCPAEMGGSIHINRTRSSIVDSIFVCRSTGVFPKRWLVDSIESLLILVKDDLSKLRAGNVKPSPGDMRCIIYGHLIRLAIWNLRKLWDKDISINERISIVAAWIDQNMELNKVENHLNDMIDFRQDTTFSAIQEENENYGGIHDEISF